MRGARRRENENVKASDMDFANQLALVVRVHTREHAKLSGISLVAQCEQVQRVAQAHGFMWRLNTYWTWEERDSGLYMQIESVSLSRSIPSGLGWMVGRLTN